MPIDPRILDLLLRWEEHEQQGSPIAPEELCRDCPELLVELKERIGALWEMHALLETTKPCAVGQPGAPTVGEQMPALPGLRYQPEDFHAKGALGEVWVAEDVELHRKVALKRIQGRHRDNPDSRRRFQREAEITGKLEHPGIVPVHGLVHDAGGEPYYAMRFIEGESLLKASERFHEVDRQSRRDPGERNLALRELLNRFVAVCKTIAYAHSRGIIHRDIKPANIMLGKYGETLVVDWGLAKPFKRTEAERSSGEETLEPSPDHESSATRTGHAKGTPAYMSPEQAEGHWDEVGPASDIYSLGATLYMLLTGQPPFYQWMEVTRRVQRGELTPPRQVKKTVPAALLAICLKAMALQLKDRYGSAQELASDVEQWLADEPVSAWREPITVRARRWLGRHRSLVTSAGTSLVVAVLSLSLLTVVLQAKNNELNKANLQERHARDQARERFLLAKETVEEYCLKVEEELRQRPELAQLRRNLLQTAVHFLEKLSEQEGDDSQLQQDRAHAHHYLGKIFSEVGTQEKAMKHYQTALGLYEELGQKDPEQPEHRYKQAKTYHNLGLLHHRPPDRSQKAEDAYKQATSLLQPLVESHPGNNDYQHLLAACFHGLGRVYNTTSQWKKAEDALQESKRINERLVKANPKNHGYRSSLGVTYNALGYLYRAMKRPKDAIEAYRMAVDIMQPLADEKQRPDFYLEQLTYSLLDLGDMQLREGRLNEAGEAFQKALAYRQRLANIVPAYQHGVARCYLNLRNWHSKASRLEEAADANQRAINILDSLSITHPDIAEYQTDLVHCCMYQIGDSTNRTIDPRGRGAVAERSLKVLERLKDDNPHNRELAVEFSWACYNMSSSLLQTDRAKALGLLDRAVPPLEAVLKNQPSHRRAQQLLANTYSARAGILGQLSRFSDEERDLRRAQQLDDSQARHLWHLRLADASLRTRQYAPAMAEVATLANQKDLHPGVIYDLARICALCATGSKDTKLAEEYASLAVQLLVRAVDLGSKVKQSLFANQFDEMTMRRLLTGVNSLNNAVDQLSTDRNFDALRLRDDFKKLLSDLEAKRPPEPIRPPAPSLNF